MATNVSGGVFIDLLQNGDSLNTTLNATQPLYQTFKKGTNEFSPNWETMSDSNRPIIYPRVYSVMEVSVLDVENISWKYNGVSMAFDSSGLCTAPDVCAGRVAQIDYQGAKALKMVGNVASDTNNDSDTISFVGSVFASGSTIEVSAEITLLIEEASANLYRLFLNMDDDVIDGDETSLTMTASLYNAGALVSSGVQYEFLNLANNQVLRAKGSAPSFDITKAMIDSELMVLCKAYVGDAVVAQEQRQVWDSTDPYTILCDQGSHVKQSSKENLTYSFSLYNGRLGTVMSGIVFSIKVIKVIGAADITSQFTKTNTSVTIPGSKVVEHRPIYIDTSCSVN